MSVRHPVAHHVAQNNARERRRRVVDVVLVLVFLFAIGGILTVHTMERRSAEREALRVEDASARARTLAGGELARMNDARAKEEEFARAALLASSSTSGVVTDDEVVLVSDPLTPDVVSTSSESAASSTVGNPSGVAGFVRFADVTVARYDNARLGFVMEIPEGWKEVYARSEDVVLANSAYSNDVTMANVVQKQNAMWMHIVRPCTSMEATSTVFHFATTSGVGVREASSCVPPFLLTIGYRADAGDFLSRELFLLSMSRTLYPIVRSEPPYLPLR